MNSATELLSHYELIAGLTQSMLRAARDGDWDGLIELEKQYRARVDELKPVDAHVTLDDSQRARKHAVIRRILDDDARIRDLATPHLMHLDRLLRSSRQRRALQEAYGNSR